MRKYEENRYILEEIKDQIYPWVKGELADTKALNGKYISEKDTPVVSFISGLRIIFVIKWGEDVYEVLKDNMLPPDCDVEALYYTACENLVRDVEFVIANTWYGGFAILADGWHEASSLCFKHIWQVCVDKLKDDLVIMAPTRETVLFAPASNEKAVAKLKEHGEQTFEQTKDRISTRLMLFTKDRKELTEYED
ncbi:hypothetical protein AALD22_16435 [Lachnospiraceae bacterium 56-18]|jgi:hypothetical protein|uniref:hypothetical protein n=1 Tax=Sporofaciens sp. JLR.KK001 TaxID=3112621 RepID=UPI002FF324A1